MTNEGGSAGLVDVRALLLRTDWNAVEHCCPNVAPRTPVTLRQLLDDDPLVQGTAVRELSAAVTHSGSFYSATAPAALFVAAILGDPRTLAWVTLYGTLGVRALPGDLGQAWSSAPSFRR
jgi:hypothetical protein